MRPIPVYGFYPIQDHELVAQPLALAMVMECARLHRDGALGERYDFSPGMFYAAAELLAAVQRTGPGVCLFSNYVWNAAENRRVSAALKELHPECVTIHGGPSTPRYPEACAAFLTGERHVDVAVRGEGEVTLVELLDRLWPYFEDLDAARFDALEAVRGTAFLAKSGDRRLVRASDRELLAELDSIPSPYLSGFFDRHGWNFDQRGWSGDRARPSTFRMLILETNRGCPYGCTFCDWGSATLQKMRLFGLERIEAELAWMGRHRAENLYIADANFGILPRDLEVAGLIARTKEQYGFPTTVVTNYTKNGSDRLPQVFRRWASAGIAFEPTVSIQSTDPTTLRVIRRSNIKTSSYLALSDTYRDMNLPVRVQLMFGLPGSTLASWKRDLQFFFDRFEDVQGFRTQMLPNSPMADPAYIAEHAIELDEHGYITSCNSFTEDEYLMMAALLRLYQVFHNYSLMKWFLRCFQWERGVRAVDFMYDVVMVAGGTTQYPALRALLGPHASRQLASCYASPTGWSDFYREVRAFTTQVHGGPWDEAVEAALAAQEALMPAQDAAMPRRIPMAHDFVAYMRDVARAMTSGTAADRASVRFEHYAPGELLVTDPGGLCRASVQSVLEMPLWSTNPGWELECALNRVHPSPGAVLSRRAAAGGER